MDFQISADQICGGGEEEKGSCRGDSGGGLYIRDTQEEETAQTQVSTLNSSVVWRTRLFLQTPWTLLGLVSYGKKRCGSAKPEVYVRVENYIDWIRENMRN